jgi:hypothetical protein
MVSCIVPIKPNSARQMARQASAKPGSPLEQPASASRASRVELGVGSTGLLFFQIERASVCYGSEQSP